MVLKGNNVLLQAFWLQSYVYLVFPTRAKARSNKGEHQKVVRVLVKKGWG